MKHRNRLSALSLLAMTSLAASAQFTQSGYFNDGYMFRHDINPAIANRQSYVAFPALGNINIAQRGNVGIGDFVYERGGETVTFMHPDVSVSDATKPFSHKVRMENDLRLDLFSVGVAGKKGGYTTVSAGVRSNLSLMLPGQLFRLAKEGPANDSYDLSDFRANLDAYGEVAVGHSRKIGDKLSVGGKVKFLLGMAHIDANADGTNLTLGDDQWEATANAELNASLNGLELVNKTVMRGPEGQQTPREVLDDYSLDTMGLGGFGAAIDLGATYNLLDMVTFGVAVVDLGFIRWNNNHVASTDGPHSVSTGEFVFSADPDADNSFEDEMERLGDAVQDIYELTYMGDKGGTTRMLGATLNLSAEYAMPFYKKFTVGLLNTTRLQGERTWNETRLSLNVAPVKWFALSVTGAAGTFGPSFGGMVSLHPKGFSLYAGFDSLPTPISKDGIPLGSSFQGNFGIVFPF